ncbi:MAG: AAA family ATPase [Alphaproteobacteria bacterium]
MPMLIVFAGLPGSGKSTLARLLATELSAVHIRIDSIEQAIRDGIGDRFVGPEGYLAAYAVVGDNLALGHTVIADSVNPIALTRDAWRAVGEQAGASVKEVEIVCSDPQEHRHRVETRTVDVPNLSLPTWEEIVASDYQPWTRDRIIVDTAGHSVRDSLHILLKALEESR